MQESEAEGNLKEEKDGVKLRGRKLEDGYTNTTHWNKACL